MVVQSARCTVAGVVITPRQWERYWLLRREGFTMMRAAKESKISYASAKAKESVVRSSKGDDWRAARVESSLPEGPVRRDKLCAEAVRALEDFEFFRLRYFGHQSMPWQIEAAELAVGLLATDEKEFLVVNVCPGGGKTTLFTHDIPAWLTVRDRSVRGIIGSKTFRQAEMHCARLRRTFERTTPVRAKDEERRRNLAVDGTGVLARDFGRFRPLTEEIWTRSQFTVEQDEGTPIDEKESTWTAFGMDSGSLGWRVNYITWDDVVDTKVLRTLEGIEAQRRWWDDEAETRLEPGGLLVLPGQRLASNDLYRYNLDKRLEADEDVVEEEATGPLKYRHVIFRAHYDDRCVNVHKPGEALPYPEGCLLDPVRVSWRDIRTVMRNPKFRTVYQQEDADPTNVLVPEVWFDGGIDPADGTQCPGVWDVERDLCELPKGLALPLISVATVDPSPTKMWALQWWVYAPQAWNQSFLMDLERRAMPANMLLDYNINSGEFYGLMEEWQQRSVELGLPIKTWIVEVNAAQRFLLQYDHVSKWQQKWSTKILPHSTTVRKMDEERGPWIIRDHFRHGRVRVPGKYGKASQARFKMMKLRDEVTRYPEGQTDDEVYACWFYFAHIPKLAPSHIGPVKMWVPSWAAEA